MSSVLNFSEQLATKIREYKNLVTEGAPAVDKTLDELAELLTELIRLGENLPDEYSDVDVDAPDLDRGKLKEQIQARFPKLGWYFITSPDPSHLRELGQETVGDAIDDLMDIYQDLHESLWHFDRGDSENGIWYAKIMFGHWGKHALELKRHLHLLKYGF